MEETTIQGPIVLSAEQISELDNTRDVTGKTVIYRSHPSKDNPGFHDILVGDGEGEGDGVWLQPDGEYNYG